MMNVVCLSLASCDVFNMSIICLRSRFPICNKIHRATLKLEGSEDIKVAQLSLTDPFKDQNIKLYTKTQSSECTIYEGSGWGKMISE